MNEMHEEQWVFYGCEIVVACQVPVRSRGETRESFAQAVPTGRRQEVRGSALVDMESLS
jgi:hypothetical protein